MNEINKEEIVMNNKIKSEKYRGLSIAALVTGILAVGQLFIQIGPIMKRFIVRHRLNKKNPKAKISEPVESIIYYVDRGVPEPIRSDLIEGASWWNEAFEAIGYKNAFQAKLLPEGADPMDVRYNMINWVHRATRGWSYGGGIRDPRTGEIIKGHVALGSLRIRQDFLIAEALIAEYEEGNKVAPEMLEMALARIRQLSCHEVGHTLEA